MLNRSIYLFMAQIAGYATRMLLPMFLVRILTKGDFGYYNQFFLAEGLIETFFQLGSNQALYYFVPRDEKNAGAYFVNSILLNIVLFSTAYLFIGLFRNQIADLMGMPIISDLFWQLFGYTMVMMLGVSAECYLTSSHHVKESAIFVFTRHVLISIVTLWAAFTYRRVDSIITALVAVRAASVVGVLLYIHFKINGFKAEKYLIKFWAQAKYGAILGFGGIMWTVLMRLHQIYVTKNYDIETFAVYSAGLRQIPVLRFYSQSVSAVMMSEFAKLESTNQWGKIRELWEKVLERMYGIGIPITLFFLLISKPLILFMFTSEYSEATPIFQIRTISMLYFLLNPTLILRAMNRNDITLKVQGGALLVAPLFLYFGSQLGGLVGIIIAHTILMLGIRVVSLVVLNRMIEVHLPFLVAPSKVIRLYRNGFYKGKAFVARKLIKRNRP